MACLQVAPIKASVLWLQASHIPILTAQPAEALAVIKKSQP